VSTRQAVRRLIRAALDREGRGTVDELARVIAEATACEGAVLWEAPDELRGSANLSVAAIWLDAVWPTVTCRPCAADPITELALQTGTLAIPADLPYSTTRVYDQEVTAALPLTYTDGCRGVLTLLGGGELTADAFDTVVELIEIVPELRSSVRERRTLALVNSCNGILHDADVESRERPLSRERLSTHLSLMCAIAAEELKCAEVSILIEHALGRGARWRLLAVCGQSGGDHGEEIDGQYDLICSGVCGPEPLMQVRLLSGDQVIGLMRFRGTTGPPHHFTTTDLGLLSPIAALVSRYWQNWVHRWEICDENTSWRRLAAGMMSLNELLATAISDPTADPDYERRMATAAARVTQEVVAESVGVTLTRAPTDGQPTPPLARAGEPFRHTLPSPAGLTSRVLRTRHQETLTEAAALADEGIVPDFGWLLCTPVGFGQDVYGYMEAAGPAREAPANAAQVQTIIGDQLGLYRHLTDTLRELHRTRVELERTAASTADAMEDIKHQLASPLWAAVQRTDLLLLRDRLDTRMEPSLKAIRGLCRKAARVATSAGVFASLSRDEPLQPRSERLSCDELLGILISSAADAQLLCDANRSMRFVVESESIRTAFGRRLAVIDRSFLQQCVGNLLDNATKYGYDNTRVEITGELSSSRAAVLVRSVGHPMSPRDVERCRERNWRGDAACANVGEGSGLGLWIADRLMCAMRGRLSVEAVANTTLVRLSLPLA